MTKIALKQGTSKLSGLISEQLHAPERIEGVDVRENELIIHAPGFEDRTMAILDSITSTKKARAVLLDYRPRNEKNRLEDVRSALTHRGIHVSNRDVLEYDRFDPNDFESRLRDRFRVYGVRRVIVDISTMSKLAILLILNVCAECHTEVIVHYAEAEAYGPTEKEFEEARKANKVHQPTIQIFTGVHGVTRVESMASVAMQGQPTAAIVFMSFNDALTQALLNTVYPSRLFLVNGEPPVHRWRAEATAWIHDQVRREWEKDNPIGSDASLPTRAVSTLDYRQTVSLLLDLYWELSPIHRVLLAPSGSKMQAVGCYIVKALHPDIHIEYPSPEGFFPRYSTGIGDRWRIKLGDLHELLSRVSTEERRQFLELAV